MEIKRIKNFNTDIRTVPPSYQMKKLHTHNVYELIFILEGACIIYINKNFYKLESGSLIIIPSYTPHRTTYLSGSSNNRIVFYFDANELEWFNSELHIDNIEENVNELVLKIPKKRISYLSELFPKWNKFKSIFCI